MKRMKCGSVSYSSIFHTWVIHFVTLSSGSKLRYCLVLTVHIILEMVLPTGYCKISLFAPYPTAHLKVNYKKKLKLVKQ